MKEKVNRLWSWLLADKKRLIGIIVLIIATAYGVYWISTSTRDEVSYQTSKVEKGTIVSTVSASGQVLTTNTLAITTEASGVVKKVYVEDGDKVIAGQKLAEITLDTSGLEKNASAYASYVSAQNSVNSAKNSYRSAQASAEKVLDEVKGHDTDETLAQKELRTKAEVARDNAYDAMKSADANLVSSGYNYRASSPIITAPFAGVVGSVNLVSGMVLSSSSSTTSINSQRVAVIKSDSLPVVSVSVSEVDVPKVKVGQKVTVIIDSLADKTFTGTVATIDRIGTVSSNVTSYTANIKLDTDNASILPNMAVTANIILETKTDVLIAPTTSIVSVNGENMARVLKNGSEAQVPVEVGLSSESGIEIITGLSEGDEVITGTTTASTDSASTQTKSVFSSGLGGSGNIRVAR